VSELDEAWALALADAESRARLSGRSDVADYLALRNSNDLLRRTAIEWLVFTFTDLAARANREGCSIQISNSDDHRFSLGQATMVGRILTLKNGVRTLFVEAGWPRTPRDGFIRGGGLAGANIRHLGIPSASAELLLVKGNTGNPCWVVAGDRGTGIQLVEAGIAHHLEILLDKK
jgi:hypothetical protein